MKRTLLITIFLVSILHCFSQAQPSEKSKHINLAAYLIELQQVSGQDSIIHTDSAYGFRVTIPLWWRIRETPPFMFGGTFPAIETVENALVFKCFKIDKFKSASDFENWVVKDYSIGQAPKWADDQKMLLKKELPYFKELGSAYKVQLLRGSKIYDCCYILTETSTAYIWIDFTATSATYPVNFSKFKEVVSLLKRF